MRHKSIRKIMRQMKGNTSDKMYKMNYYSQGKSIYGKEIFI